MEMSTQIGDLIFDSGKTLFEILDSLDVPQVANQLEATNSRLDEVNDQLRQLSVIVDNNQANNNASFVSINTQLDNLNAEVTSLSDELSPIPNEVANLTILVNSFDSRLDSIDTQIDALDLQVDTLSTQVTTLTGTVNSFNSRITSLEANRARQQFLFLGNEYIFSYRIGGLPGTTHYYRITYSGSVTTHVNAASGYSANVLDSLAGTSSVRIVYLAGPFDMFSVNGRYHYPMIQGPCALSFSINNTSPIIGYITTL